MRVELLTHFKIIYRIHQHEINQKHLYIKVHVRWPRFEGGCYLGEDGVPELRAFGGSVAAVDGRLPNLDGSVFGEV